LSADDLGLDDLTVDHLGSNTLDAAELTDNATGTDQLDLGQTFDQATVGEGNGDETHDTTVDDDTAVDDLDLGLDLTADLDIGDLTAEADPFALPEEDATQGAASGFEPPAGDPHHLTTGCRLSLRPPPLPRLRPVSDAALADLVVSDAEPPGCPSISGCAIARPGSHHPRQ
jgi:hypothetical protein